MTQRACVFVGIIALLLGSACASDGVARPATLTKVTIDDAVVHVELAVTSQERGMGLSGRQSMPEDQGMLFVLPDERRPTFAMRDMRFPLDFVWIDIDRRVVGLDENVAEPAVAGEELKVEPPSPVLYVLELNGGTVQRLGIAEGDAVTFEPEIVVGDAS